MRDWKELNKTLTNLIYVGQLGLDLIMPVLLCMAGAWYLDSRLGWGAWVYFPALILGLGAGGVTFKKFYHRVVMKGIKKPKKDRPKNVSFSRHI